MKLNLLLFVSRCFLHLSGLVPAAVSTVLTVPHRYELITTFETWPVAQDYCRAMYTDLAIILSDTDWLRLNKVTKIKGVNPPSWVGLWNDVNSWRWSLGDLPLTSVPYTNWLSGQPDNNAGKESCVFIGVYNQWCDAPCSELRPFICYDAGFTGAAKFIFITSPVLSWLDARAYCRQYHTDLASALNSSDQQMLNQLITSTYTWIGLYRDTWKWTDGTNATNLPWLPGQPDNFYGNENNAIVLNDQLSDIPASFLYYFYCYTNFPTRSQIIRLQVKSDGSVFDHAVQSSILNQMKQKLVDNGMSENITVAWRVQPDGNIFYKKNNIEPNI